MSNIAIIDLGSSTIKVNVVNSATKELIHKYAETVNMAEGFYPDKIITDQAFSRVIEALIKIKNKLKDIKVSEVKLVTTGVARKAVNIDDLKRKIKSKFNWDLKVISEEQEAELFYKGVVHDFDESLNLVAINIGGGSTEVTFGNSKSSIERKSFPIGVSNLNEMFVLQDPVHPEHLNNMFKHINDQLTDVFNKAVDVMIYTGGELDYMEKTNHPLENSKHSKSHPKQISLENFKNKYKEIKAKTKEELYKYMPENPRWMDGAVSCSAIAIVIAEKLQVKTIVPSNKNLIDGLLLDYVK